MGQNQLYGPSFLDTVSHRTKLSIFPSNWEAHKYIGAQQLCTPNPVQSELKVHLCCVSREGRNGNEKTSTKNTSSNTTMLYLRYTLAGSILICSPFLQWWACREPANQTELHSYRLQQLLWQPSLPIGIKTISHTALHRSLRCSHPFSVLPMSLCPCLHIH